MWICWRHCLAREVLRGLRQRQHIRDDGVEWARRWAVAETRGGNSKSRRHA